MPEVDAWFPTGFLSRQGHTLRDVLDRLDQARSGFLESLAHLDDSALQRAPAPGKWSPAEIADHLIRTDTLFAAAIEDAVAGRVPRAMSPGRLTADGRAISPDEGKPVAGRLRQDLLGDFEVGQRRLVKAARAAERVLERDCIVHSFFGPMTVLDLMRLSAWHLRHHTKQLPERPG